MEDQEEGTIDKKYLIKEKKGSGGTANVFLVTEINKDTEYVAKVLKKADEKQRNIMKMKFNI